MSNFEMKDSPNNNVTPGQLDFSTLVLSFGTGAMIHMGLAPDPSGAKVEKNLVIAKQNIDVLEILETKTRGNLSQEEQTLIKNVLSELRLRFIDASK